MKNVSCHRVSVGRGGSASRVLLLKIIYLKAYDSISIPGCRSKNAKILVLLQARSKKPSKRKKLSNSFDKNRADVLAASNRGSHVEQEKLIALDEEEQSRWETRSLVLVHQKLKIMAKMNLQNWTHKSHCNSWLVKQFSPNLSENFLTNLVARAAEFRS